MIPMPPTDYSVMTPELKHWIIEHARFQESFINDELEQLIARTDDPDLSLWVGQAHGLQTSTIEAHLAFNNNEDIRELLMTNPEAPIALTRLIPAGRHAYYAVARFIERMGVDLDNEGPLVEAMVDHHTDERPLGVVWDELVERYGRRTSQE